MHYQVNKVHRDEFGRVSGILAVNKPVGITSHDVVDKIRRILGTRQVGHAGALDPFATGVLIILVGKATKLADDFIEADKEYVTRILFGISTDSADTEGKVLSTISNPNISGLQDVISKFSPQYEQYVSIFSSVKVDGQKLRVLARKYQHKDIVQQGDDRFALFYNDDSDKQLKVKIPKHLCQIPLIEIISTADWDIAQTDFYAQNSELLPNSVFPSAVVRVACSKGTYIRALGEDIGQALTPPVPAMLVELDRTRVADITKDQAVEIEQVANL